MNIVIYNEETINPQLGGVKRVSYILNKAFQSEHNIYCLMPLKLEDMNEDNYYYFPDNCIYSENNVNYLQSFIREKQIDVIINQNGISPEASYFLLKYAPTDVKIITVPHNSLTSTYGFKQHVDSRLIPYIPKWCMNLLDNVTNRYMLYKYKEYWSLVLKRSDSIALLHEYLLKSTLKFLQIKDCDKITWIENPCTVQKDNKDLAHKENILLFVGRVAAVKNVKCMIRVWELIYEDFPDWKFVIVGDGKDRISLAKYVEDHKIPRIQFEGTQNPITYYERSKVFCMASYYEGMPLVLLEAMSFGVVPIVINSFETAPAIVEDGKNGILLDSFSAEQYARGLTKLMADEDLLHTMSNTCLDNSKKYTIENIKKQWYKLFESIIKK